MKLHWSPRSPYVRKVMIVAHEAGVADRIELVRSVALSTAVNPAIQADNPLGKIPALVLDDGRAVFDSLVICEHLSRIAPANTLFPVEPSERLDCLVRHALGQGLTDALIQWRNERNRAPEMQLKPLLEALELKVAASLDRLEAQAVHVSKLPFDVGHAAAGCALSYLDFRFADVDWRQGRSALRRWHETFEARASARATVIEDA